jgi:hypothetical protein
LHVEFVEAEKGQIGEDPVDDVVVAAGADGGVEGREFLDKHLDEVFVTDAAIEHLLDKHFLVGVFALIERERENYFIMGAYFGEVGVRVGVNGGNDRVEGGNALGGILDEL